MVSYSRADEAQARKLSLGLQATGMAPWLDVQASNVSPSKLRPKPPTAEGARGIGFGLMWQEALEDAPPEKSYGVVLLTHNALDKFDIIGGVEIPGMLKAASEIVIAHSDEQDAQGRTVLERVKEMIDNGGLAGEYGSALQAITNAIEQKSEIAMRPEYFDGSPRDLGNFVVGALAHSPNNAFVQTAQEAHTADPNAPAEAFSWGSLKEQLDTLRQTILPNDLQGLRSFEEAQILIEGVARPDLVAARLQDKGFNIEPFMFEDKDVLIEGLIDNLKKLGLERRFPSSETPGIALLPLSEGMIKHQWQRVTEYLLRQYGSNGMFASRSRLNPTIWQIWDGNVPAALDDVRSEKSTAKWLSSVQAAFAPLTVEDPYFAACLVTKQVLVEIAKRY